MISILKSTIESSLWELTESATSTTEIYNMILANKYKPVYASIYQTKLSNTKQINFIYIDDYYNEIKSLVQYLSYSLFNTRRKEKIHYLSILNQD